MQSVGSLILVCFDLKRFESLGAYPLGNRDSNPTTASFQFDFVLIIDE